MEGQFSPGFGKKMDLELIQVDPDELRGFFDHCVKTVGFFK